MIGVREIVDICADEFGVSASEIRGRSRSPEFVRPRHAVCALAQTHTGQSMSQIGADLGGRDHATIRHATGQAARYRDTTFTEPFQRAEARVRRATRWARKADEALMFKSVRSGLIRNSVIQIQQESKG